MSNFNGHLGPLAAERRFVLWKSETRAGRRTKVPKQRNGRAAKSTDPTTWATLAEVEAAAAKFDGVGIVLNEGLGGVDLDACIDADGALEPWADEILARLATYAEVSPSGRGIKALFRGATGDSAEVQWGEPVDLGEAGHKRREVALYTHGRYFTLTGRMWMEWPIREVSGDDLAWVRAYIERLRADRDVAKHPQVHGDLHGQVHGDPHVQVHGDRRLPDGLRRIVEAGAGDGERSEQFHHAVCWLADLEFSEGDIVALLRQYPAGIAAKYLDRLEDEVRRSLGKRTPGKAIISKASSKPTEDLPSGEWPPPQPLTSRMEPEPYPVEALPLLIRSAVEEVQAFSQAPLPLVACSALGALSLAVQGHIDVERAEGLDGPTGLYVLVIAESSERKSSTDAKFTAPIRAWERSEAKRLEAEVNKHKADMDSWRSRYDGIVASIKSKASKGDPTETEEAQLRDLRDEEPEPPRVPHLIYTDVTPEALAFRLAKGWPSAGIVCAEGGTVLGAHGMNADSISRNLALLNSLFSGEGLDVVRKTSESFRVDGARLTVNLAVQAEVLQAFHIKSGGLARGSGFWSRFLLAWPTTTRGERMFKEPPKLWPHLSAYQRRLTEILDKPLPLDADGRLAPQMMRMSAEAFEVWRSYYDIIEAQQRPGADLAEVSDVAGKSAENVARVAALFHYLEHGAAGQIGAADVESAVLIVAWHLSESRRFFGELALPEELLDATRLDAHLLDLCRRDKSESVGKRYVQQFGPVRNGKRLEAALAVLVEADRVRVNTSHRPHTIHINPGLLRGIE